MHKASRKATQTMENIINTWRERPYVHWLLSLFWPTFKLLDLVTCLLPGFILGGGEGYLPLSWLAPP